MDWFLFVSIHHSFDQLDCDTATGHDRSKGVGSNIEDEIAGEHPLDLVAPSFPSGAHFAGERIKLDDHPFVFRSPFVFEGIDGTKVQINGFDINAFLENGLNVLYRLDDFSSHLAYNSVGPHLWRYDQHAFGCEGADIGNFGLCSTGILQEIHLVACDTVKCLPGLKFLYTMLDTSEDESG